MASLQASRSGVNGNLEWGMERSKPRTRCRHITLIIVITTIIIIIIIHVVVQWLPPLPFRRPPA
jgi:hypothetical protein